MPKVLIVDDRPKNLTALEAILEGHDVSIIKATSGNEALSLLLEHEIALILLDVQMPDMDGFETAELIRQNNKTKQNDAAIHHSNSHLHKSKYPGTTIQP